MRSGCALIWAIASLCSPALIPGQDGPATARASGSCSSAISGNSNTVTVNCLGVSGKKADDLIKLMNKILERKIDPNDVASQLDRITQELSTLRISIDPVSNAPAVDQSLLAEAQNSQRSCTAFSSDWSSEFQAKMADAIRNSQALRENQETQERVRIAAAASNSLDTINAEYSAKYKVVLAPKLIAWRDQLTLPFVQQKLLADLDSAESFFSVITRCKRLDMLTRQSGENIGNAEALYRECQAFSREWQQAPFVRRSEFVPKLKTIDIPVIEDDVARRRAATYQLRLAPYLVAWQKKVLSRASGLQSSKDYAAVRSSLDLQVICADISNLASAYRERVVADVKKSVNHP